MRTGALLFCALLFCARDYYGVLIRPVEMSEDYSTIRYLRLQSFLVRKIRPVGAARKLFYYTLFAPAIISGVEIRPVETFRNLSRYALFWHAIIFRVEIRYVETARKLFYDTIISARSPVFGVEIRLVNTFRNFFISTLFAPAIRCGAGIRSVEIAREFPIDTLFASEARIAPCISHWILP